MKRWVATAPLAVLALLGVLFATFGLHHNPHFIPDAMVGQPVPDETLPSLDTGERTALKPLLHGSTFVSFFASWCAPCEEEAPALAALRVEGARIIGVAYEDDPAKSRDFLARLGNPYDAVLVDRGGRAGVDFGVDGVPDTFLVGPDGVILAKHAGPLQPAEAQAMLERASAAKS